jgi:hypothetical protein
VTWPHPCHLTLPTSSRETLRRWHSAERLSSPLFGSERG